MYPQTNQFYPQNYPQQYPGVPVPGYGGWQQPNQPATSYSTSAQPRFMVGRTVNSPEEITAADVPMDGSVRLFPTGDGSAIYRKEWDGNGHLNTVRYVPEPITPQQTEPSFEDKVMSSFDELKDLLKRRDTPRRSNPHRDKGANDNAND